MLTNWYVSYKTPGTTGETVHVVGPFDQNEAEAIVNDLQGLGGHVEVTAYEEE